MLSGHLDSTKMNERLGVYGIGSTSAYNIQMFAKHTCHFSLPKICVGETKSACTGLPFQSVSTHHFSLSTCMASHLTSSSSGTTSAQGAAWIFKVQHSSCHSLHLWQVLSSQQTGKRQKMTARFVIIGFYILPGYVSPQPKAIQGLPCS